MEPLGFTKYRDPEHYYIVCICVQVLSCVLWISSSVLFSMLS